MSVPEILLVSLLASTLGLDIWAIWRVFDASDYSTSQRLGQIIIVLCVPIFGACLVLYLASGSTEAGCRKYPEEKTEPESISDRHRCDAGAHD